MELEHVRVESYLMTGGVQDALPQKDVTDDCRVVRFVPCHCLDMVIGRTAPHNPPMSSEADLQPSSFAKVACVCGGADESTNREDEA